MGFRKLRISGTNRIKEISTEYVSIQCVSSKTDALSSEGQSPVSIAAVQGWQLLSRNSRSSKKDAKSRH